MSNLSQLSAGSKRLCVWLGVVAAVGLLAYLVSALWVAPATRFQELQLKYPPGTPAQRILDDLGENFSISPSGNVLPYPPTAEERQRLVFYFLRLPEINAEIQFNANREVIRIEKISDLQEPR